MEIRLSQFQKALASFRYLVNVPMEPLKQIIDDRKALSHIYKEEVFQEILVKFVSYLNVFEKVLSIMEKNHKK